ncbi:SMI1/KNR4 family protein [Mycobacteroides abscessus]|uniref:SMI1/KNR4 family protein n=1 Tax=Mycobacteroides abscessus TaxID=36809 RepID=UPI001473147E
MDPAHVWKVPPYESSVQPPLTEALLDATERQLGVRLPESLVALLWGQNGGHLRVGFPMDRNYNTTHEVIRGIGPKSPRLEKAAWWHDPDWGPPRPADAEWLVPFDGDGHWDLCLDYRRSPTDSAGLRIDAAVVVIDTEARDPDVESFVAASFDEYLAQLVPSDDE